MISREMSIGKILIFGFEKPYFYMGALHLARRVLRWVNRGIEEWIMVKRDVDGREHYADCLP